MNKAEQIRQQIRVRMFQKSSGKLSVRKPLLLIEYAPHHADNSAKARKKSEREMVFCTKCEVTMNKASYRAHDCNHKSLDKAA